MKLFFWFCLAGILWCYIGYPLMQLLLARLWPRRLNTSTAAESPTISAVLAVRNGAAYLERRVMDLLAQEYPADRLEVIVVCNGCTDATGSIAEELSRTDGRVRVLVSAAEQGKAGALNMGVAQASGDFIIFADVRQSFAPGALRALLEAFADPEVGAVSGRLLVRRAAAAAVEGARLYWRMETRLRLAESLTGSVVGVTGAIYAVRRACFEPIPATTILDDVWLPMRIVMAGYRVVLEPRAVAMDTPSEGARDEFLRKRRTMVGNLQLVRLLPELLSPARNPLFVRYLSHKLLRLASPFLALGTLLAAALVPELPYRLFFLAELSGYLLGGLGLLLPLRALSLPSAFVMMHAAIFSAFLRFRADAGAVWAPAVAVAGGLSSEAE